jgi:dihydroorotase-like cyclic amidohydrolase
MSRARRRTARALDVLRRTVDDGPVTSGVESLARWLEQFHPRSLVELDYGGLTHLLDDAELQQDESARDVAGALAALDQGDPAQAAAAYSRVMARAKALQAVESAN